MPRTIAVIDGNSLMHRAYHAVPPTMTAPDGNPTNAVFGFCSMLFKFIEQTRPDGIVCAFDAGKPQFRIEVLERYKAHRPHMDEELRCQFGIIESLLEAMAIPVIKVEGWEGDDILGTVAARNEQHGFQTLLLSGDKDINQLVTENTRVVTTKKGISEVVIFNPEAVEEKYGITPQQFRDYLGFMGDSSDNIPGVPGVGAKTAQKLLAKYGSMEEVYDHLDDLSGKLLENIQENRELAFLSREVATIKCDLDFELDVETVRWPNFDAEEVVSSFKAIGFNSHLDHLMRLVGLGEAPAAHGTQQLQQPQLTRGQEARVLIQKALLSNLGKAQIGIARVEKAQEGLFGTELSIVCACEEGCALLEGDEAQSILADIIANGRLITFDVKDIIHEVFPSDSAKKALVTEKYVLDAKCFDVGLATYVLDSSTGKHTLSDLLERYCRLSLKTPDDEIDAAALQAQAILLLAHALEDELREKKLDTVFADIDAPLIGVLAIMERTGAAIDSASLTNIGKQTEDKIATLRGQIISLAGEEFNIDSPQQLGRILFEVLGLPHGKKTKRGYSTDAKILKKIAANEKLAPNNEICGLVLQYRELAKIKSTYIDALPAIAASYDDGRVHTTFNETVTATGRLSSSNPNLQNIPVRTDFGKQIRSCFVPLDSNSLFLSADYSQIELRLLAHLSEDKHLIAAFQSGIDFHATTAARIFDVEPEEVTPQMRSRAKAVNFGIVYGQQAFGLSQTLNIPQNEASHMIDRYFEAYPQVRSYLDTTIAKAKDEGYAETMFGRRRYIPELKVVNALQRGFGERTAMNHPMQGSAADIIKLAMRQVAQRLQEQHLKTRLLLQVHDELDFSVPRDEIEPVSALVKQIMENVCEMRVPLIVDISYGDHWAQAH